MRLRLSAIAVTLALAACSGGGGSPPAGPPASGGGTAPQSSASAPVTFQMQWASAATPNAKARRPQYLAPTALSVSISVVSAPAPWTTATPIIEVLNNPTSTISFTAPTGLDTFLIQTYDEQNALGNVLSKAFVTQTVSGSSANVVSAILNGVIASFTLGVSAQPTGGVPATFTVSATALDADGNAIVGPGTFAAPIQLAISDPSNSNTLSLSPAVIQQPGGTATLSYNGQPLEPGASIVGTTPGVANAGVAINVIPATYYYNAPPGSLPQWITVDTKNNVWFTDSRLNAVGELVGGTITETAIPTANSTPEQITVGTDGNIYFTEYSANKIGELTPGATAGGTITEQKTLFFGSTPADNPYGIVSRGDGTIWYVGNGADRLGYITENGLAGETTLPESPTQVFPYAITTASDGYLYFTETASPEKIGRINNLFGTIQEFPITVGSDPRQIVQGSDGNLWFTEYGTSKIGVFSPYTLSVIAEYPTLTPNSQPVGIVAGPDGALWFTESGLDKIGRITTSGVMTEYAIGTTGCRLQGLALRSSGAVFFVCPGSGVAPGKIGKLII